jgi:hypothetical protein
MISQHFTDDILCLSRDTQSVSPEMIVAPGAISSPGQVLFRASFSDNFGQSNCVILRESCKPFDFAFSLITRSLAHICAGIAQSRDNLESGFEFC